MKSVSLILFLCSTFLSNSQTGAYNDGSRKYEPSEVLSMSISPLALLDVYTGSQFKGGFSVRPTAELKITADVGVYSQQITRALSMWENMKGFNFRSSAGLFLGYTSQFNIGIAYEYKIQSFSFQDSVAELPVYNLDVDKFAHVVNVYASYDAYLSYRLYLEIRCGLGMRYRDIFNSENEKFKDSEIWWDSVNADKLMTRQQFMPNLSFAIRLNYSLWKS